MRRLETQLCLLDATRLTPYIFCQHLFRVAIFHEASLSLTKYKCPNEVHSVNLSLQHVSTPVFLRVSLLSEGTACFDVRNARF